MFKSSYKAGYAAGKAEPVFKEVLGLKYIVTPECPLPRYRFINRWLWEEGRFAGQMARITRTIHGEADKAQ